MFASMLNVEAPDLTKMSSPQADRWLATHWRKWMSQTLDDVFSSFNHKVASQEPLQNEFI
jgi:hypothetical protein